MSKIKGKTINSFLDDLASNSPTPGGGSAAALTGAIAASLVSMVANLTIKKKGYEKVEKQMVRIAKEANEFRKKLLKLADEDADAFNRVMKAYKTKTGIEVSLKYATEVPLETAEVSFQVLELANYVIGKGNKNALSDAKSAKYFAQAAINSAKENLLINIKYIKDQEFVERIRRNVAALS